MARKSVEALTTKPVVAGVIGMRLPAPDELSEAERALWVKVADTKPAVWFDDANAPVLVEYVRAAAMCNLFAAQLAECRDSDSVQFRRLLRMRNVEAMRLLSIATKLRLTVQAKLTAKAASTSAQRADGPRPWGGDDAS